MFRNLIGAFVGLAFLAMAGTANATLIVFGGELQGATNVDVNGTLFDVDFVDGSCVGIFTGCDNVADDFAFDTLEDAAAAAQALLDTVFIDGAAPDLFDTDPELTRGCFETGVCRALIPFALPFASVVRGVLPRNCSPVYTDSIGVTDRFRALSFVPDGSLVYAVFTPVPEPSTLAILAVGLAGMAFVACRRRTGVDKSKHAS